MEDEILWVIVSAPSGVKQDIKQLSAQAAPTLSNVQNQQSIP